MNCVENMIKIIGAKGLISNVDDFLMKISKFAKDNKITIQAFNADVIYDKNHLISAFEHAKRAMDRKTNTTNSLEMEILLYSSGERQLKLAIPKMGIKKNTKKIAFILISKKDYISNYLIQKLLNHLSLRRCDDVLNIDGKNIKKFGINEKEIKTVSTDNYEKLIIEKVALVDIIK